MLGDRSTFLRVDSDAYFNHASISPLSSRVRDAVHGSIEDWATRGARAWMAHREQRDRLRAKLARLIGAEPSSIGLVPSTSQGVVDIASGIPWQAGERIILLRGEFPANVTPWQRAADRFGLEISWLDTDAFRDAEQGMETLRRTLAATPRARLVAVSAVQFQTGLRMPLERIGEAAREHGAKVFVDAIQAVGASPLDVGTLPVDYVVAGSHKWLMGPEGAGFVWVRDPAELQPIVASWMSVEDGTSFLFEGEGHLRYDRPLRASADVFEIGAQNSLGFVGLEAAVDPIAEIGVAAIHAHVQAILDTLEPALVDLGFESERHPDPGLRSTILAARPPAGVGLRALFDALSAERVDCAIPDGRLRFSPHWPNDIGQARHVISVLTRAVERVRD